MSATTAVRYYSLCSALIDIKLGLCNYRPPIKQLRTLTEGGSAMRTQVMNAEAMALDSAFADLARHGPEVPATWRLVLSGVVRAVTAGGVVEIQLHAKAHTVARMIRVVSPLRDSLAVAHEVRVSSTRASADDLEAALALLAGRFDREVEESWRRGLVAIVRWADQVGHGELSLPVHDGRLADGKSSSLLRP